ncbi:MFS general substrate transporter [Penicillium argentinense]|uniref:MFS general substrate transporter n=1 Tax=Penicillium argentinense TaxID=1131581 RepID=A0A9W9G4N8_9EURO|nr:MFS general substrate transporter [Penicillium argentinense]KAJ5112013.1 MFS general substrate transporter [Penicillium argentinense]
MYKNVSEIDTEFPPGDPENPRNWPIWKRVTVSTLSILGAFCMTSANSIYLAAIPDVKAEFHVSLTKAILPITLFTIGLALGPVVSAAVSEIYGRKPVYWLSLVCSIAFTVVAGSATSWAALGAGRLLSGSLGGPLVAIVAGTINDIWDTSREDLGNTFYGVFAASLIWGTEVGPVIGHSIKEDTRNWRWTFWLTAILLGVSCMSIFCPETYGPQILRYRAKKRGAPLPRRGSLTHVLKAAAGRPLHMLVVEPIIAPTSFISSISLCVVFFFYIAFPMVFERLHGFSRYQSGLAFLSLLIGSILGLVYMTIVNKAKHRKAKDIMRQHGIPMQPEELLYPAMLGGVLLPVSLFWFAWTAYASIHWVVPLLAGIPFGAAYFLVMLGWPLYKNSVYGNRFGASALAAEGFMRYGMACVVPLFSVQMVDRIGIHWSVSIAAFISLILVPIPWVIYKIGPRLRRRSRYVPTHEGNLRSSLEDSIEARV